MSTFDYMRNFVLASAKAPMTEGAYTAQRITRLPDVMEFIDLEPGDFGSEYLSELGRMVGISTMDMYDFIQEVMVSDPAMDALEELYTVAGDEESSPEDVARVETKLISALNSI